VRLETLCRCVETLGRVFSMLERALETLGRV